MTTTKGLELDPILKDLDDVCRNLSTIGQQAPKMELEGFGTILQLKALNRLAATELRVKKSKTQEAKQLMDRLNLQLQNLHYEQMNLARQLENLQSMKPAVPWSDLISLSPEQAARISHQEIVERLTQELQERRNLEKEVTDRQQLLLQLEQGVEERSKKLASTTQELDIVVERAERVRDNLFEPGRAQLQQQWGLANGLPAPLYTLFTKASSFASAFATPEEISITLGTARPSQEGYQRDPNSVQIVLLQPVSPLKISLVFEYLVNLGIVILNTQITPANTVLNENPLRDLLYNDSGLSSPNPFTSVEADSFNPVAAGGFPFRWVQDLCGLNFVAPGQGPTPHKHVGDILHAIRNRVEVTMSLKGQAETLQKGNLPPISPTITDALLPFAPKTRLIEWKVVEAREGCCYAFSATFERSRLKVEAEISVPHAYPASPSTFSLKFTNQGSQEPVAFSASSSVDTSALALAEQAGSSSYYDNNVKAIESELNHYYQELLVEGVDPSLLLTLQIRKLMMNIDIYIEAEKKDTIASAAMGSRKVRGRDRLKPFKYTPGSGLSHRNHFF